MSLTNDPVDTRPEPLRLADELNRIAMHMAEREVSVLNSGYGVEPWSETLDRAASILRALQSGDTP